MLGSAFWAARNSADLRPMRSASQSGRVLRSFDLETLRVVEGRGLLKRQLSCGRRRGLRRDMVGGWVTSMPVGE